MINAIWIFFKRTNVHKVNVSGKKLHQLVFHTIMVKHSPVSIRSERNKKVDIAVGSNQANHGRTENCKLLYFPSPAKIRYDRGLNSQIYGFHFILQYGFHILIFDYLIII